MQTPRVYSLSFVVWLAACTEQAPADPACREGEVLYCTLPHCEVAYQHCDGSSWTSCECEKPETSPADLQRLGAACRRDSECPNGAFCLEPSSQIYFEGGPPSGLCVADCSDDVRTCDAYESATCVRTATARDHAAGDDDAGAPEAQIQALCFETCEIGDSPETKCHERDDIACEPIDAMSGRRGFCRPLCVVDDDCDGRACDVQTGACVEQAASHDTSLGHRCRAADGGGQCDGLCVALDDDFALCSHRCIFGESGDCAPLESSEPHGGCLLATPDGVVGDVGYCAELCDCAVDCNHPDAVCDPFVDDELKQVFGREGVCVAASMSTGQDLTCK